MTASESLLSESVKREACNGFCRKAQGGICPSPVFSRRSSEEDGEMTEGRCGEVDRFYVVANYLKDPNLETAMMIRDYLEAKGKTCIIQEGTAARAGSHSKYTDASRIPRDMDCVLVLGGDGTLLHASRDLVDTGLPLLGINLGTLGYLAEIDLPNIRKALDQLIDGNYTIEDRMMIQGVAFHHHKQMMEDIALNDIVIQRRGKLHVVDFNIFVDDTYLCSYRADGFVISTPTGSTGYSLSAGGPIVSPNASLILLTAVAAHTLTSRSIVLPDNVAVTVEIGSAAVAPQNGADVTFDGDTSFGLDFNSSVRVTRSKKITHIVKINNTSFVEILREKMK